jgi:hypothetical protein
MSDQDQRKSITADNICEQAGVRIDGKKPTVRQPHAQCDLPLAGRELQFLNVDNCDLSYSLRRSMATKNFSVPEGDRWPAADLNNASHHLKAIAQLKPDPTEVEPFLHEAEISEWQERTAELVRCMDDLTADVLDIIFATWLKDAFYPESTVVVTADDCLRHRGLNPKKGGSGRSGGYHTHQRQEIARHIDMLQNTRIRVFEREVTVVSEGRRGPERKRVKWAGEGPVIIVSSRIGPVTTSGDIEPRAWKIRPGDVFAQFLIGPGRQTALISQKALHYDPYRQYWEKRITRFLAYLWRIRQGRKDYLAPISVEALLQGAGLRVNKRNPKKTRCRLEKALDQLGQDGVIRSWRYVPQVNEKPTGRKGWSKVWVSWKVQIEPPGEIVAHYSKMSHTLPGKKALPAPGK